MALAQLLPPAGAIKWRLNGDGAWAVASNWAPAVIPAHHQGDMLFGSVQGTAPDAITVSVTANPYPRSLWFDADSGISYTINSTAGFDMGSGVPNNGTLVAVISSGPTSKVVETNINGAFGFGAYVGEINPTNGTIINNSRGGLRFGGNLWFGGRNLIVSGSGATHFAGGLRGSARSVSTVNGYTPHLILSGNNTNWSGALNVGAGTLVFIKANGALGTGANVVASGGTLGFRSHAGTTLNYNHDDVQSIQVSGVGAVRAWGQPAVGAIYHDGGGSPTNLNRFTGDIELLHHTYFGARGDAGGLHLSGKITSSSSTSWPDGYWFIKTGPGLITLSNPNNAWLRTYIYGGVLRITNNNALPTGNLALGGGGILELGSGNFSRQLGAGSNQVRWTSASGGFSAYGGHRTVSLLNSQGNLADLTWGSGGFVRDPAAALLLSSRYANNIIELKNPINLGSGDREIRVERGHTNAYAIISGAITGTGGGLTKTGPGLLHLTGSNTYSSPTIIKEGVLIGPSPNSNIQLNGGVLGLDTDFTANLGTGAGEIQWIGSGSFAAYGGDRIVRLNNTTDIINWGDSNFVQTGQELRFGHYTATGTVIWDKELNLGSNQTRTIYVERGEANKTNNRADVVFNKPISGYGNSSISSLNITGNGRMDIAVNSPSLSPGRINIFGAELRLIKAGAIDRTVYDLQNSGTLTLDNLGTHNSTTGGDYGANRIANISTIRFNGGILRYIGRSSGISEEIFAYSWLGAGSNTIELRHISSGVSDFTKLHVTGAYNGMLRVYALQRLGYGTLNYITNINDFSKVQLSFWQWDPAFAINGVIPWGAVNGTDFITPVPVPPITELSETELRPVTNYHTNTDQNTWSSSRNLLLSSTQTLGDNRSINSLKLGAANLGTSTHTLTINSGGLLTTIGNRYISDSGTIKTGSNRPLYAHIYSSTLNVYGNVGLDVPQLVKTGPGTLIFESAKTQKIPDLYIHQGTVDIRNPSTIQANNIYIGDGAGRDILILPKDRTDPLINKPSITLRGTPYGLDLSNVYGGAESDQAILRLSGNTKQHINILEIRDRGTIDFAGGEVGLANILWIDRLNLYNSNGVIDPTARLFIRNWYQYEDYLLIHRTWFNSQSATQRAQLLSQIIFEGYQDFPVLAIDYDANYYQITPFHSPEPSTYGAILGTVGIGLVIWKRRRRRPVKSQG